MVDIDFEAKNNCVNDNAIKYDPDKLAELARQAIGTRSATEFCLQTQLSKSFVSRVLNGKLNNRPTKRTLYRFAAHNSKLQNGVTLEDMLEACGYETTEDDYSFINKITFNDDKSLTLAECIQIYYAQSPAFCLNIFLNVLIAKGYGKSYSIDFKPGMFSILIKSSGESSNNLIGIPAFCNNSEGITAVQVAVLTNLIMSINTYSVTSVYFIITDNETLYKLLLKSLPVIPKMNLSVLLTNNDYTGFSKQDAIVPKSSKSQNNNAPIDFPILLCD